MRERAKRASAQPVFSFLRKARLKIYMYQYHHWRTGGGGGLGGALAPPPQIKFNHGLFSMYRQNIERNSSLRM